MLKRIVSGAILLPILLFIAYKGGFFLLFIIDIAIISALFEVNNAFKYWGKNTNLPLLIVFSQIQLIIVHNFSDNSFLIIILPLILCSGIVTIVFKKEFTTTINDIFTFCYCSLPLGLLYKMRMDYEFYFWSVFIISMTTDTFAYFCGKLFGKRKLIERLSPNKTIEGSVGGIVFAIIGEFIFYGLFFKNNIILEKNEIFTIVFSLIGSIISQFGDLFASSLKRMTNIKDYGHIIPGHGGIMDRADSIIFTTIYVYSVFLLEKMIMI